LRKYLTIPFPLLFLEKMELISEVGKYNEVTQTADFAEPQGERTVTTTETATGGRGDTDSDASTD